ncbi:MULTISPECIES: hypothetical protein [unclassified Curtobacterium]|uniref:hypothetical protein n=1 Tax=unclassified Curtobacterium TaxID=257496 RepID=UPI0038302E5F
MSAVDAGTGEVIDEPGLDSRILHVLASVGIHRPDRTDHLHVALVNAIGRTLGGQYGDQLAAMRFEVVAALQAAGEAYAMARTDYEAFIDRESVRLVMGPDKVSRTLAEQVARASDKGFELKLAFLLAEKRDQFLRKLLDAFAAAGENHTTSRADQRAADRMHAQGYTGAS